MTGLPLPQRVTKTIGGLGCLFCWGENGQFGFWWGCTIQAADTWRQATMHQMLGPGVAHTCRQGQPASLAAAPGYSHMALRLSCPRRQENSHALLKTRRARLQARVNGSANLRVWCRPRRVGLGPTRLPLQTRALGADPHAGVSSDPHLRSAHPGGWVCRLYK